jgi:hypothetical protein
MVNASPLFLVFLRGNINDIGCYLEHHGEQHEARSLHRGRFGAPTGTRSKKHQGQMAYLQKRWGAELRDASVRNQSRWKLSHASA